MKNDDFASTPPLHPGKLMVHQLMRAHQIDMDTLSQQSGIDKGQLTDFANGEFGMTQEMANNLVPVFGDAVANTLYEMQQAYEFFQQHGHRPQV